MKMTESNTIKKLEEAARKAKKKVSERTIVDEDSSNGRNALDLFRNYHKKEYDKTRQVRTDIFELVLPDKEPELYHIEGDSAQNYVTILKDIGVYDKIIEKRPDFDFSKFDLDMGGCDKKILDVLPHYLDNHIIIMSPHQKNMSILRNNYSFLKPLLMAILDGQAKETIAALTPYEPLYGELKSGLELLLRQLNFGATHIVDENFFSVQLSLDTPTNTIKKMASIRKDVMSYFDQEKSPIENALKLLDYDLEDKIVNASRELNEKYINITKFILGDERSFIIDDIFPLKLETSSYKFSNDQVEMYSFKDDKYFFVYFMKGGEKFENPDLESRTYILIDGSKPDALLNKFHKHGIIDYNIGKNYIKNLLEELEQEEFSEYAAQDLNTLEKNFEKFRDNAVNKKNQQSRHSQLYLELRKIASDLEESKIGDEKTYMAGKSLDTKLSLLFSRYDDPLVNEIFSKLSKDQEIMTYTWSGAIFKQQFGALSYDNQKSMLKNVLKNIKFVDQYNTDVNDWLLNNHKALCDDIGVKFVSGGESR